MTPDQLSQIGRSLYGVSQWRAQMARDLPMSFIHLSRMLSGQAEINRKTETLVVALVERRAVEIQNLLPLVSG